MKNKKIISIMLALAMAFSMVAVLTISASASEIAYSTIAPTEHNNVVLSSLILDLEDSEIYSDAEEIEQGYSLAVNNGSYNDVTKVQLAWTITDISATRQDGKIWNPDTLSWDDDDANDKVIINNNGEATFTLTNLSSIKINAAVSFEAESGFKPTVEYSAEGGSMEIGTVVEDDKTVNVENSHAGIITVTVTPDEEDFATLSAIDSAKYGTYKITINGKKHPIVTAPTPCQVICDGDGAECELILAGSTTGGTLKYAVSDSEPLDSEYSEKIPTTTTTGEFKVWYKSFGNDKYEDSEADYVLVTSAYCFAKGTKITMADGTLKNVENVIEGDSVLTFNHETGNYEAQKVFLAWHGEQQATAFTLHFDNGNTLSLVGEHDLFEKESLQYETISYYNAISFIGKHFYSVDDEKYVKLLSVTFEEEKVDYYSIYTDYNANCIANGMLSTPDDDYRLFIYKYNEDLTVDLEQLNRDIAEFGLYEYPENALYTKEIYNERCIKYINIVIGKGIKSFEEILEYRDAYAVK